MGDNNNDINTKKIFRSFFKLDRNNKDRHGRLNQRYFKEINRNNNWIDNNPYLPPFWGFILYSIVYFVIICSALFYVGVMKQKTDADDATQLDKPQNVIGGSNIDSDTPYYFKAPFYSNDNSKTLYDMLSVNHIFTGYKEPGKSSGLYASIFDMFHDDCPDDLTSKIRFVYAFNLMYIENKLNDLTKDLNEAIQDNNYFNALIIFVKWIMISLEIVINIFKDPIGLFLILLAIPAYFTTKYSIYTAEGKSTRGGLGGSVIKYDLRADYRYDNKTYAPRNRKSNNEVLVKDIYINTMKSIDDDNDRILLYNDTSKEKTTGVYINKYFKMNSKFSAFLNKKYAGPFLLQIDANPTILTKGIENEKEIVLIGTTSKQRNLNSIANNYTKKNNYSIQQYTDAESGNNYIYGLIDNNNIYGITTNTSTDTINLEDSSNDSSYNLYSYFQSVSNIQDISSVVYKHLYLKSYNSNSNKGFLALKYKYTLIDGSGNTSNVGHIIVNETSTSKVLTGLGWGTFGYTFWYMLIVLLIILNCGNILTGLGNPVFQWYNNMPKEIQQQIFTFPENYKSNLEKINKLGDFFPYSSNNEIDNETLDNQYVYNFFNHFLFHCYYDSDNISVENNDNNQDVKELKESMTDIQTKVGSKGDGKPKWLNKLIEGKWEADKPCGVVVNDKIEEFISNIIPGENGDGVNIYKWAYIILPTAVFKYKEDIMKFFEELKTKLEEAEEEDTGNAGNDQTYTKTSILEKIKEATDLVNKLDPNNTGSWGGFWHEYKDQRNKLISVKSGWDKHTYNVFAISFFSIYYIVSYLLFSILFLTRPFVYFIRYFFPIAFIYKMVTGNDDNKNEYVNNIDKGLEFLKSHPLTLFICSCAILLFNCFWFFGLMLDSYANDTLTYTGAITGIICCIIIYYMIKKE